MPDTPENEDNFEELMEGILTAGPTEELGEGHLNFDEDEDDSDDDGMMVGDMVTDDDGSGGAIRTGRGKWIGIGAAVLGVAIAGTAVVRFWPSTPTPPNGNTTIDNGATIDNGTTGNDGTTTIDNVVFDDKELISKSETTPWTDEEWKFLFDEFLQFGFSDEETDREFMDFVHEHQETVPEKFREMLQETLRIRNRLSTSPSDGSAGQSAIEKGFAEVLLSGISWRVCLSLRMNSQLISFFYDPVTVTEVTIDELKERFYEESKKGRFRSASEYADELIDRLQKEGRNEEALTVCTETLRTINRALSLRPGGTNQLQNYERNFLKQQSELLRPAPPRPTIAALKTQWTSLGVTDEQLDASLLPTSVAEEHKREFEAVKADVRKAASEINSTIADRPDTAILSMEEAEAVNQKMETVRQGWLEVKLRMQVASSGYSGTQIQQLIDDVKLDENLSALMTPEEVDALEQPQLLGKPTPSEVTEFAAVRKAVGLALLKLKEIIADTPEGQNLSTDSAADAMIQLQIVRIGWREMTVMQFVTASRTDSVGNGLTLAQVNATLAGLKDPGALPGSASPAQTMEYQEIRERADAIRAEIEAAIAGKADDERLEPTVVQEITANLEELRSAYLELQIRRLLPSGGGGSGTNYLYADANTPAAFKAALNGLGIPADPSTLKLARTPSTVRSAAFEQSRQAIMQKRTAILASLKGKPDDKVLEPGIVAPLAQNLEELRITWVKMQTEIRLSEISDGPPGQTPAVYTPARVRAILAGMGDLDSIMLQPKASKNLVSNFESTQKEVAAALAEINRLLPGSADTTSVAPETVADLSKQIEIARRGFAVLRSYAVLSGLPATTTVLQVAGTTPSEIQAVLRGLGLPEVLDTTILPNNAPEPLRTSFAKSRTRVSDSYSAVKAALDGIVPDATLDEATLASVTAQLETVRSGLLQMVAHIAVSHLGQGTGGAGETLTREQSLAFLAAVGLPERLKELKPGDRRPAAVSEDQFAVHKQTWSSLNSDVNALKKLTTGSGDLTPEGIGDPREAMNRILVNFLKLETALQIATLRFPQGTQSAMSSACIPQWISNNSGMSDCIGTLQLQIAQSPVPSGPTLEQVHYLISERTHGLREEFHQNINAALLQPRVLPPEQLETVSESAAKRVMGILAGEELPPFTLPPDPSAADQVPGNTSRTEANRYFQKGYQRYCWRAMSENEAAINDFSTAAQLDPRNPLFRYFLALSLRRSGQHTEAARQARIGASLETRFTRSYVHDHLERIMGQSRAWLEGLRKSI